MRQGYTLNQIDEVDALYYLDVIKYDLEHAKKAAVRYMDDDF